MAFLVDEAYLPATLTVPPMSDEQFAEFAAEHPDLWFEMTAEGELIVMPPNYTLTGMRNQEIAGQFMAWASVDGSGIAGDSSTGFVLPNGARRSPDLSWTRRDEVARLSARELETFWHVCPSFVIEVRSHWDRLPVLRAKMREWIGNGAELGWMIDAENRTVEIFRAGREVEVLTGPDSIAADGPVSGFVLKLRRVWEPLGS